MDIADAYHECDEEGKTLKALLDSLPQDLDQTYARILKNIPEKNREKALKLLRWLSFTARPLTIREAAEALAIRVADDPDKTGFNPSAKFRSPCEILQLCPGMINKIIKTGKGPITATGITESDEIMLAHFSVKEYLRSDGILSEGLAEEKTGRLSYFSVREQPTNCYQARACLAYMSHLKHRDITEELLTKYPLATYSAQFWPTHARLAKIEDSKDAGLIQDVDSILKSTDGLLGWIKLFDPDHQKPQQDATRDMIRSPLYYVSLCGLSHHTKLLIDQKFELEASGGCYHRPLLAACRRGFPEVVRHLLDAGADFRFRVDKASAMMCAVKAGHIEIVRLLLNKEKEVNPAKDIAHFDAALVACTRGYKDIVNLILAQSKGTNVNDDNGYPRSTLTLLQEAATRGHDGLVRLLLDLGAEIDREGGWYGTAIRAAALEGHFPVVKTLLDRGANPMLHGGSPGSALIAAISFDRHRIVDLLLQSELTDVNYNEGMPGSALQSAASKGKLEFVRKLLQSGARVNAEGGLYHSALQAACARGHDAIVDVLLDHGATVDTPEQGPADVISITPKGDITAAVYLVPYHKAGLSPEDWHGADFMRLPSDTTDDKIKQLLSSEPLIAVQKGIYGSALRAAIFGGHRNIANRLLEAGANIYAQGGAPHSLMHIMAMAGNEEMRQLFPDNEGTADSASHATHWKLDVLSTVKDKLSEEKLQAIREKHQALGGSILDVGSFDGGKRQAWLNLSWDR